MRTATQLDKLPLSIDTFQEKAFFDVIETEAAYLDTYGNWVKTPDKKVICRKNGSYISTVGKNYQIVENKKYFETVIEALSEAEVKFTPKNVYIDGNGKRTTMIVTLPQFTIFPNSEEELEMELRVRNSFDTTLAADTLLGFLRLICTNGMTSFEKEFSSRITHKGNIESKTQKEIELYKNFEKIAEQNQKIISRLAESNGKRDAVAKYIGDGTVTLNGIFKGERWANKLYNKWQEENETTNMWELYNIFTEIISHEYGYNYSSKLNKMNELNKEVKTIWGKALEIEEAIYG